MDAKTVSNLLVALSVVLVSLPALAQDDADMPPALVSAGLFLGTDIESASSSIALGPDGALHAAYSGYDGASKDKIYYALCAEDDCAQRDNWRQVAIDLPGAREVQVEVTPDGRPRIFVTGWTAQYANGSEYSYGECDDDCLDAGNWTFGAIAASADGLLTNINSYRLPARTFALDEDGRPRFIYADENYSVEPDHYGAFYMACDQDCTDKDNWIETDLANHMSYSTESFVQPVLALGKGGKVRVLAQVYAFEPDGTDAKDGLYYYFCDKACTDPERWNRGFVIDTGGGSYPNPTWDMALTEDGAPRLAVFAGDGMEQTDLDHQLIYIYCDQDCDNEDNWNGNTVQPGDGHGESPDIELDDQGHPRIAFTLSNGDIGLARCEESCESPNAGWWSDFAERSAAAQAERPQYLPFHCDGEIWQGFAPDLVLDGEKIVIGYDIAVEARCLYKDYDDPQPSAVFHEIFRGARVMQTELTY